MERRNQSDDMRHKPDRYTTGASATGSNAGPSRWTPSDAEELDVVSGTTSGRQGAPTDPRVHGKPPRGSRSQSDF